MVDLSKIPRPIKESDLVNAYLWTRARENPQWRRVRLGQVPTKEMARMYMVVLRWVDAIYIKDNIVHLVEAKLRPDPGAFGQLELYKKLFYNTPEFEFYKEYPIQLVFLTTTVDVNLSELASEKRILYEVLSKEEVETAFDSWPTVV